MGPARSHIGNAFLPIGRLPTGSAQSMKKKVFYSWQSDLPNATNRGFIHRALEQAASAISGDVSIDVEPVVDRDTVGVAGSPDIAETILDKIVEAEVLVPDVSLVTPEGNERRCPNPNVLVELGFAVSKLGWPRIIMVMNTAFGLPSELPFDLRGRRVLTYTLPLEVKSKTKERKLLARKLKAALRAVFENLDATARTVVPTPVPDQQAIRSIESAEPDRVPVIRRLMKHIDGELVRIEPDLCHASPKFKCLKDALDASIPIVAAYGRVASRAAEMRDARSLSGLYRGLELIASRFEIQGAGLSYDHQYDYWRFIGHELAVMLAACMIREELWEPLGNILERNLILKHTNPNRRNVPFTYLCKPLKLVGLEGKKRQRTSYRADLLRERHSSEPLATLVDFEAFMEADYFLFLRAELPPEHPRGWPSWIPESAIFQNHPPRYLLEAERIRMAQSLAAAIGVDGPETLRSRLLQRHGAFGRCFPIARWTPNPFAYDMDTISRLGSR